MNKNDDKWIPSVCYICYGACGIKARCQEGVLVDVMGNPDNPHNREKICAKGKASIMSLYDPYRVKVPLKRTNPEKGVDVAPRWQEISWEEALETIVEKLKEVREKDPRGLVVSGMDFQLTYFSICFASAFGTPNFWQGAAGYFCGNGLHPVLNMTQGSFYADLDLDNCNYCLLIGTQAGFMTHTTAVTLTQRMAEARARGMRVVAVDPIGGAAAAKADEWIPIRPGTDAAFCLGIVNLLVNELGIYDASFIKKHTNGPYLVGTDGLYLRDQETSKVLVWDSVQGQARPYDATQPEEAAIEGEYTVGSAPGKPAFQVLREHVAKYTPEQVERITTVPAATLRRIASEFAQAARIGSTITIDGKELPHRPTAAVWNKGPTAHQHSLLNCMAIQLLNVVVGALDVPGGMLGSTPMGPFWEIREGPDGLILAPDNQVPILRCYPAREVHQPDRLDLANLFPAGTYSLPMLEEGILHPERYQLPYRPQVMLNLKSNWMVNSCHPTRMAEVLKKIPFVVHFTPNMDETTRFADLVLPEVYFLERLVPFPNRPRGYHATGEGAWYWTIQQPVAGPLFEARSYPEVIVEIAKRLGILGDLLVMLNTICPLMPPEKLDPSKPYTWEEIVDVWARSWFGPDHGLEWFRENGVLITARKKMEEAFPRAFLRPKTPIYMEHLIKAGREVENMTHKMGLPWDVSDYQPLPDWKPCPAYEESTGDLYAVNYKLPFHHFSTTPQNPWLDELAEHHPYAYKVLVNPVVAASKGIKDGDLVWVESAGGKLPGRAKVTECVHPEVVGIAGTFGHWSPEMPVARGKGVHFNSLLPQTTLGRLDMVSGALDCCIKVKISRRRALE